MTPPRAVSNAGVTRVLSTRSALDGAVAGRDTALVATMGALHAGHVALIRAARARIGEAGLVVVSVFVNPLQFGDAHDLDAYPRALDVDLAICADEGVDLVFTPGGPVMYPTGDPSVTVDPGPLGTVLEGAVRPGHFRGVLTVVHKLLGLTGARLTVFGEKDYQQLVLVRRMVADLDLPVEVFAIPTVRDGVLPLSSRNSRLTASERDTADLVGGAVVDASRGDAATVASILTTVRDRLDGIDGLDLDYATITDDDLGPAPDTGEGRLLVAARVGTVRILDNARVPLR